MNRTCRYKTSRGASLIELIAFIVVAGIVASSLSVGLVGTLGRVGTAKQMTEALQLGQERMELIRARKDNVGFACFTGTRYDPCQSAAAVGTCPTTVASLHPACGSPPLPNYSVAAALDETGACMGGNINYKCVSVTVNHAESGQLAQLLTAVASY